MSCQWCIALLDSCLPLVAALLFSQISRESIDAIKKYFVKELKKEDLVLLAKLKRVFNVPDAMPSK